MKIVLNKNFGGFHYPEKLCKEWNCDRYGWIAFDISDKDAHMEPALVEWVENNPNDAEYLEVVEIPDNATDWQIHEYDGLESVIAVIDGKIKWF